VTYEALLQDLPDGTFIEIEDKAWLVAGGHVHAWTPFGYEKGKVLPGGLRVKVLTPQSVVNAFRAGYVAQINDRSTEGPAAGTPSN
jgi:hypothetical protein